MPQGQVDRTRVASRDTALESIELVWDEGLRSIDAQLTEAAELDRKTSPLIGLISAGIALVIAQREPLGPAFGIFLPGMGAVLAYLLLGFRLRRFARAPALPALVPWANSAPREVRVQFMGNLVEAYEQNSRSLAAKELYLMWAMNAMLLLLLLTPFVIVFLGGSPR
jgi:hypothetical protein